MTATGLAGRVVDLCRQVCVTGDEAAIADALEQDHASVPFRRVDNSLVVGEPGDRDLVLLVGHIDVVPATDADVEPRIEERDGIGAVVVGRGTSDMKGGVAVAESLYRDPPGASVYDLALVLYSGEEGPADANELQQVLRDVPWLADAALAIVLEPTDLEIHAGCLGGLHAEVAFAGRPAHSARPWDGENALTGAGEFLTELDGVKPVDVEVGGIVYRDVLTATQAWTDNARNVVPGRFVVNVNYRFAPNRGLDEAEDELRARIGDRAAVEIVDRAPPAPPRLDDPTVRRFVEAADAPVAAKQAWTDVARFAAAGVPALNFGPGLTSQAHQAGEYVPVDNLTRARDTIAAFLAG